MATPRLSQTPQRRAKDRKGNGKPSSRNPTLGTRVLRIETRLNTVEGEVDLLRAGHTVLLGEIGRLHARMGEVVDKVSVIVLGAEQKFTEALDRMEGKLDKLIGDPYSTQRVVPPLGALDAPGAGAKAGGPSDGGAPD